MGFLTLMLQVAYRDDGALMREKMKQCQLEGMQSVVERIVSEGVASGEFFVADVPATAQMLLRMYLMFTDEIAFLLAREDSEDSLMEEAVRKLNAYRTAIERILIAPFGSIVLMDARDLYRLAHAVLQERIRMRADAILNK